MDSEKEFYVWRVYRTREWGNELINWGVTEEVIELPIEHVLPQFCGCIDRDMRDVQEYLDTNYPEEKYVFEYQSAIVKFNKTKKWKIH